MTAHLYAMFLKPFGSCASVLSKDFIAQVRVCALAALTVMTDGDD